MKLTTFLSKMNALGRPWTKAETKKFQKMNNEQLIELNSTLRPSPGPKTGTIGIFCAGQAGDASTITSVLKYKDELWPNKKIVWYINFPNADLLRYAPIDEVRPWPWAGAGLAEGEPDHWPYMCMPDNRLNLNLAATRIDTMDLEDGYFPAPHQLSGQRRAGVNYPNCSKRVFGVPDDWEWHPLLSWSAEEQLIAAGFITLLPVGRKIVCIESFCGSGQSKLTHEMIQETMKRCEEEWGPCNFIFVSHKYLNNNEKFPEGFFTDNVVSAAHFTVREAALLINFADLFISVSSGVSCASSAWGLKPTPILQYCGSAVCGTKELANGECIQVFSDERPAAIAENDYYNNLTALLLKYKI